MEEQEKDNSKIIIAILLVLIFIVIIIISIGLGIYFLKKDSKGGQPLQPGPSLPGEKYEVIQIDGQDYYHKLTDDFWEGEFKQYSFETEEEFEKVEIVSYADYVSYINELNQSIERPIPQDYTDSNSNYVIVSFSNGHSIAEINLIDYKEENNNVTLYGDENVFGIMGSGTGYLIVIPTNKPVNTQVSYIECYSTLEIRQIENPDTREEYPPYIDKPIIYLYPTEDTEVSVKLSNADSLTCSYPKYENGWKVIAKPNGELRDLNTDRELYALYYENESNVEFKVEKDGFVVKGEDSASFLEEKLAKLGLTEKEAEEFIVYWLPKMEANKYNYIRFATPEEIEKNMALEINPNPDTTIRVLMTFKGLENPIEVEEQELVTPERVGFVAVEWGGTEIK